MQRKTNLFYTNGQDSNFLTFSNFTEALTGNFLSTDWKVYPSRFLCLYIPSLINEEDKNDFIKNYLVAYYENKLAFLRDYYTNKLLNNEMNNFDIEGDVNSLAWLFETFNKYISDKNEELSEEDKIDYEITFIGEVTEFDYKGTYTDTICIIDSSEGYNENNKIESYKINVTSEEMIHYDSESDNLYGWHVSDELNGSEYQDLNIKLDDDENREYSIYSEYSLSDVINESNSIKFNIIIPLFDITDINPDTNFNEVDENTELKENFELKNYILNPDYDESNPDSPRLIKQNIDLSKKEKRSINNPLGIWFSDEVIELKRDPNSKYAPSWSLVISSQFKPFPYSGQYHNNDITSKDNQQAFATYARILSQQLDLSKQINNISTRLTKIEQTINRLDTAKFEELNNTLYDYNLLLEQMKEAVNSIDTRIDTKLSTLENRWKSVQE